MTCHWKNADLLVDMAFYDKNQHPMRSHRHGPGGSLWQKGNSWFFASQWGSTCSSTLDYLSIGSQFGLITISLPYHPAQPSNTINVEATTLNHSWKVAFRSKCLGHVTWSLPCRRMGRTWADLQVKEDIAIIASPWTSINQHKPQAVEATGVQWILSEGSRCIFSFASCWGCFMFFRDPMNWPPNFGSSLFRNPRRNKMGRINRIETPGHQETVSDSFGVLNIDS